MLGGERARTLGILSLFLMPLLTLWKKGKEDPVDITVTDLEKCFDSLWAQECINTLYEYGIKNDKLVLLYKETKNALIALKIASGLTKRESIRNIPMQGSVFGSLVCTAVMDKLAKIFYKDESLLYKYKGEVEVPVIGMVDDVLCVAKCSNTAVTTISTINSFMELNKLKLAANKCGKIHIGKKYMQCPVTRVHGEILENAKTEK